MSREKASGSSGTATEDRRRVGRILVVDDSAFFRELLTDTLGAAGHEVLQAGDGLEALELIEDSAEPPDLILLDLMMPRMDGYELLARLRERFAPEELPVVAFTELLASDPQLDRLKTLGCNGYLNKLAPPDHVRFRVGSALHPQAEQRNDRPTGRGAARRVRGGQRARVRLHPHAFARGSLRADLASSPARHAREADAAARPGLPPPAPHRRGGASRSPRGVGE